MLVFQNIYNFLKEYSLDALEDPRVKDLPLINKPWLVFAIVVLYVYFVKYKGVAIMKNRQPFELKKLIVCYNIIQIIANFVCSILTLKHSYIQGGYSFICAPVPRGDFSPSAMIVRDMSYIYFIGKIIDLMDTVFFILRKKNSQITFLHVYHHVLMVLSSFVYVKFFSAGGQPVSLGKGHKLFILVKSF